MTGSEDREQDIARLRAAAAGLEETTGLAGAALDRLAPEGRDEDETGRMRVQAVLGQCAGVEAGLVELAVRLDGEAGRLAAEFEAMKTGAYGAPVRRFGRRPRFPVVHADPTAFRALAGEVEAWLRDADAALGLLAHLGEVLKRCHAGAETALEGVVTRRGSALAGLEAAQKAAEEKTPLLTEIRFRIAGAADEAARAPLLAERTRREVDLGAARSHEASLVARYQALDAIVGLFDVYMGALNAQRAAQNTIAAKLSADAERSALLLHAIAGFAGAAGEAADLPARVGALLASAAKGFLSHAETMRRKAHADTAFELRFGHGGREAEAS